MIRSSLSALRNLRLAGLFLAGCIVLSGTLSGIAQEEENRRLDAVKAVLDQTEATLQGGAFDNAALDEISAKIDAARSDIDQVNEALTPRLQAITTRLDQLGPKPAEGAPPESPELTQDREAQEAARQPIGETLKRAGLLAVQTDQVREEITQQRRNQFAIRVFARTRSLLDAYLWSTAAGEAPRRAAAAVSFLRQWHDQILERMSIARGGLLAVALLLAVLLLGPIRKWTQKIGQRYAAEQAQSSRLRRSAAAIWVVFITTAAPLAAAFLIYKGMTVTGFTPERAVPFLQRLVQLTGFLSFIVGLSRAILAARRPGWRLAPVSDAAALRLARYPLWIGTVYVLARAIQSFFDIIGVGLAPTILIDGMAATILVLIFAIVLRPAKAADAERAEAEQSETSWFAGMVRIVAWGAVFVVLVAVLTGYISFGFFLATQMVWIGVLGAILYILLALTDDLCAVGPASPIGRFARGTIGLRSQSFDQLCALLSGFIRLVLVAMGILLAMAPWGVQSGDALAWFRRAFMGVTLGGFSVSPAAVFGALAFLIGGILLTRAVQNWLERSYLPHTRIDDGLKNSIRTATGYAGVIVAAGLAVSSLGFGLDKLAIVAGALSVGIGFGMQSVVSNFVSGLILLAERPIKVGDWVGIGSDEGNVRRISVRSTLIELFDHSTLIVPNSDLITKPVRNWTHQNPLGRVQLNLGTGVEADVSDVRAILQEAVAGHAAVLKKPVPSILIAGTTDVGIQWKLFCFVATPRQVAATRSDLYFAVLKEFQSKNIKITASAA